MIFLLIILYVSLLILALNFYGLSIVHYDFKKIPSHNINTPIFGRTETFLDKKNLIKKKNESDFEFVRRLTNVIGNYIIHYRPLHDDKTPFFYNYLLYLLGLTGIKYFKFYEYYNGSRCLQKGYGFCSQISIAMWYFLTQQKIDSEIIRFQGHVINRVKFRNKSIWLADADYHVIIPHDVYEIQQDLNLISKYYSSFENKIKDLKKIYGGDFQVLNNQNLNIRLWCENITFVMKWVLPFALIIWTLKRIDLLEIIKNSVLGIEG